MKKSLWYTRMGVGMIIASMLLSGCQQNPDSSIVVNKDMPMHMRRIRQHFRMNLWE